MLSRRIRNTYYALAGPFMVLNGILYKQLRAPRARPGQVLRVHLGPGQEHYLQDWINLDANIVSAKRDVWADMRNPLPFHDDSIDAMYSHHVIEHLPNMQRHLSEVFRCLKPGGIYRVGGPNGDVAIRKFLENDRSWFGDFPDRRQSIGGRFENFIFCRQEHLTILTFSYLEELLTNAGFVDLKICLPKKESRNPELFRECLIEEWESDWNAPHTLIVEAEKPSPKRISTETMSSALAA